MQLNIILRQSNTQNNSSMHPQTEKEGFIRNASDTMPTISYKHSLPPLLPNII